MRLIFRNKIINQSYKVKIISSNISLGKKNKRNVLQNRKYNNQNFTFRIIK